ALDRSRLAIAQLARGPLRGGGGGECEGEEDRGGEPYSEHPRMLPRGFGRRDCRTAGERRGDAALGAMSGRRELPDEDHGCYEAKHAANRVEPAPPDE